MLLVGYFEGIDSRRGVAWRCADGQSLQGSSNCLWRRAPSTEPDPRSEALAAGVAQEGHAFVVKSAGEGLVKNKTLLAVDSTTLEANADEGDRASPSPARAGQCVRGLADEAGMEDRRR
ncbi:MAG: hypothetical protein U1E73_08860 [Planctomycetota bacterium]